MHSEFTAKIGDPCVRISTVLSLLRCASPSGVVVRQNCNQRAYWSRDKSSVCGKMRVWIDFNIDAGGSIAGNRSYEGGGHVPGGLHVRSEPPPYFPPPLLA